MFEDQVALPAQFTTAFYVSTLIGTALAIAGVFLIDAGLSRRGNVLHTVTQKLVAMATAGVGMSLIGYGIWNWQYLKAFGIENPLGESIKEWWVAGSALTTNPQHIDPAVVPGADAFQFFFIIFVVFAAFFGSLLAGSVIERVKTLPLGILCFFFGALVIPFLAYLLYGSVGPLSNNGTHEFGGVFFYILVGTWALVLAWRAGPRPGAFTAHEAGPPVPHNLVLTAIGLLIVLAGLCGYALGNGFLSPDAGYFGIALNESGMGLLMSNTWMAFTTAALGGLIVWRIGRSIYFLLIAPIAGWVSVAGMVDVADPWQAGIVAFFAPFVLFGGYKVMRALKIDEPKVVPLTLGTGIYGALATAVVATNVNQGGYFGLEAPYALGHAEITFGDQLLGVVVTIGLGLVTALVLVFLLEKTIGLRDRRVDEGAAADLDNVVIGTVAYPDLAVNGRTKDLQPVTSISSTETEPEPEPV